MLLRDFIEDLDLPSNISLPFSDHEKSLNVTHSDINIIIRELEELDDNMSEFMTEEERDEVITLRIAKSKCCETKADLELHKE